MLLSMQGRCCRCLWLMPHRCNNRHHNPISTIFHHTFFPPLIFICLSSIFSLLHFLSYHIFNENHKSQSHDYRERVAVKFGSGTWKLIQLLRLRLMTLGCGGSKPCAADFCFTSLMVLFYGCGGAM
ncbi:hypothetical protein Bca4012_080650 [Brassica carinata]